MAMFAEILDKLETIENRIDSLETAVETAGGDGELVLTGLPAAQLDSVLALASFLAVDATSASAELCGQFELAGEFGFDWKGAAEGEGAGHLGAWAGTGAYAGGKLTWAAELGGGIKAELTGGVEGCIPLGGDEPPVRAAPAGPQRAPELDQLRTTLTGLGSQFDLDASTLTQSLGGLQTAIVSPGSLQLSTIADQLPLPPAMANLANDPVGTVGDQLGGLVSDAQDSLCSAPFGSNLSSIIDEACDVIDAGGLANFTAFADITSTYPAIRTAVTTVCGRVNSIGLQRLVIPSWDVTFPGPIGTVEVFPGYNQRLFASYTALTCPS
jgi:hypothetical protein